MLPLVVLLFTACKKSGDSNEAPDTGNFSNTPLAKAAYDNNNYGIYKGVFVGSSGTVVINVNNDNTITATLKVDGTTYNFTSTQTVQQNQATSINFSSGSNSFSFTADANGANPKVSNIVFTGHPDAAVAIMKETSSSLVKLYEGTYKENAAGGETGIWNMVITTSLITGNAKSNGTSFHYTMDGYVSNDHIVASSPDPQIVPVGAPRGSTIYGEVSPNFIYELSTMSMEAQPGRVIGSCKTILSFLSFIPGLKTRDALVLSF